MYWTNYLKDILFGLPTFFVILALLGVGLFLTVYLKGIQFSSFFTAWKFLLGNNENKNKEGQISAFQALATTLSGTIGTGNIAGVATALVLGGPGAIFWMWITAILGMAIKFSSCTLAHHFRSKDNTGEYVGGPMYTLLNGLNMPKMAIIFSVFTLLASFCTGAMVQSNSIVDGLQYLFPATQEYRLVYGLVTSIIVGVVVVGGLQRIANVATIVVPFMSISYCFFALLILTLQWQELPKAFFSIFNHALNISAFGGGAIGAAMHYGIARALFASEAGLGTAPMAQAKANVSHPVQSGFVAMIGPSIDTLCICTMTALVILSTGVLNDSSSLGLQGAAISVHAFAKGLGTLGGSASLIGAWVVGLGILFFAYTTIIAWSYYGQIAWDFLFGKRLEKIYLWTFLILIVLGGVIPLNLVWTMADIANFSMAMPNLLSIILLTGILKKLVKDYFNKN